MNLQTWVKWVTEIDAITGGAIIQLRPGPYDGMTIIVRWMLNEEPHEYKHIMSLTEIESMAEADQPFVLEQITHAVSRAIKGEGIAKNTITGEELKVICDTTVRLTELRQRGCGHLCIENIAPEIMRKLLVELRAAQ